MNTLRRWIEAFGGQIDVPVGEDTPEISPTKSYLGEGLDFAVAGRRLRSAYDPILQVILLETERAKMEDNPFMRRYEGHCNSHIHPQFDLWKRRPLKARILPACKASRAQ